MPYFITSSRTLGFSLAVNIIPVYGTANLSIATKRVKSLSFTKYLSLIAKPEAFLILGKDNVCGPTLYTASKWLVCLTNPITSNFQSNNPIKAPNPTSSMPAS